MIKNFSWETIDEVGGCNKDLLEQGEITLSQLCGDVFVQRNHSADAHKDKTHDERCQHVGKTS